MSTVELGVCGSARAWVLLAFQKFPQIDCQPGGYGKSRGTGSERIALAPTGLKCAV